MLSGADASLLISKYLGDTPRAVHSRFVAHMMRQLAGVLAADPDLWEIVGLCHDLDFFETLGDGSRHGLLTIKWLGDRIPIEARHAIAAHDHRTGIQADTLLADMLKVADVIAVIDAKLGRRLLSNLDRNDPFTELRSSSVIGPTSAICWSGMPRSTRYRLNACSTSWSLPITIRLPPALTAQAVWCNWMLCDIT